MQHLGYCVLLLMIVLLSNKRISRGNASQSVYQSNNNEEYENTTHLTNSPRNNSGQMLRESFRENSTDNNLWEKTSSTRIVENNFYITEFVRQRTDTIIRVTENMQAQDRANEKTIDIYLTPIRNKSGVFFKAESRNYTTKIKKIIFCCPLDHRFSLEQKKCFFNHNFTFPFAQNMSSGLYNLRNIRINKKSKYTCPSGFKPIIETVFSSNKLYTFLDDGRVQFPHNNFLPSDGYCVAAVNQTGFDVIFCGRSLVTDKTFVFVGIIVTLIFLLITFVVYSALQEFRNMHGYTLRAYIASLFVSHMMFAIYLRLDILTFSFCAFFSFTFIFAMYSSFLWLNVTCFDIWWTFRAFLPVQNKRERRGKIRKTLNSRMKKTLVIYALYAWGVSFVATILLIIMDFAPNIPEYWIKPQICRLGMWFATEKAKIIYFYIPIGVTLTCNICLFVWTALKMLCDKKRINRQMKDSESCRHDDKNTERLWVYLKLFIIMGINWIPINLTVKFGSVVLDSKSKHAWFLASILTPLQGVIIFIIFVSKKKVISLLMERCGWSGESSLCHFRKRRAVHHEEIALAYRD